MKWPYIRILTKKLSVGCSRWKVAKKGQKSGKKPGKVGSQKNRVNFPAS